MRRAALALISLAVIGFSGPLVSPAAADSGWIDGMEQQLSHGYAEGAKIVGRPDINGSSQFLASWTERAEKRWMIGLRTIGNVWNVANVSQETYEPFRPDIAIGAGGDVIAAVRLGTYGEGGIRVIRLRVQYEADGTSYLAKISDQVIVSSVAPPDVKAQASSPRAIAANKRASAKLKQLSRRAGSRRKQRRAHKSATENEGAGRNVEEYRYNREDALFYEWKEIGVSQIGAPQVGIDGDGNAVVVYQDGSDDVVVAQSSRGNPDSWRKQKVPRADGKEFVGNTRPVVDVNDAGRAAVAYVDVRSYVRLQMLDFLAPHKAILNAIKKDPIPTHYRYSLRGKIWEAGKSFSGAATIDSFEISALKDGGSAGTPSISVGSAGQAVVAWPSRWFAGPTSAEGGSKDGWFKRKRSQIVAAYAGSGSSSFGKPETVFSTDNRFDDVTQPRTAVDSKGRAHVAYELATLNDDHNDTADKLWMSIPNNVAVGGGVCIYWVCVKGQVQRGSPSEFGVSIFGVGPSVVTSRKGIIGADFGAELNQNSIGEYLPFSGWGNVQVQDPTYRFNADPDLNAKTDYIMIGSEPPRGMPKLQRTVNANGESRILRAVDSEGNLTEYAGKLLLVDADGGLAVYKPPVGYMYCDPYNDGVCYEYDPARNEIRTTDVDGGGLRGQRETYTTINYVKVGGSVSGALAKGKKAQLIGELNANYSAGTRYSPNENPLLTNSNRDWIRNGAEHNAKFGAGLTYQTLDGKAVGGVDAAVTTTGVPSVGMSGKMALDQEGLITGSVNLGYVGPSKGSSGGYNGGFALQSTNKEGTLSGGVNAGVVGNSQSTFPQVGAHIEGDLSGDLEDDDYTRTHANIGYSGANGGTVEAKVGATWGHAVVNDIYRLGIRVATRSPNGSWSTPRSPVSHDGNAYIGDLTIGANDSLTLSSDTAKGNDYKLFATTKSADGDWGQSTEIFSYDKPIKWSPQGVPPVACDRTGNCVALALFGGGLMAKPRDGTPPLVTVPSALEGEIGSPVDFRAVTADMFSIKTLSIDYGDGKAVSVPFGAPMWQGQLSHYYGRPGVYTAKVTAVDQMGRAKTGRVQINIGVPAPKQTQAVSTQDRGDLRFTLDSIPSWWLESGQSAVPETTNQKVSVTADGGNKKVSTVKDPLSLDMESDGSSNTGTLDLSSKPSVTRLIAGGYKGKPAMLIALSKPSKVKVTIYLGKKRVGSFKRKLPAGPRIFMITKYIKSAGTYTIKVRATDENGNRSKTKKTKLRVG